MKVVAECLQKIIPNELFIITVFIPCVVSHAPCPPVNYFLDLCFFIHKISYVLSDYNYVNYP